MRGEVNKLLVILLIMVLSFSTAGMAQAAVISSSVVLSVLTRQGLQDLIDQAVTSGETQITIQVPGNISFDAVAVTIPSGVEVTLQSDAGNQWTLMKPNVNTRHFIVAGSLILKDIILDAERGGGIEVQSTGSLTMNEGANIEKCSSNTSGSGVYNRGTFIMNGGKITDNDSAAEGEVTVTAVIKRERCVRIILSNRTVITYRFNSSQ